VNSNNRNESTVPSCTLTVDTNLDKSENENVLNSARPSFQSSFPSPFENESLLKFYGGPVSDELCVPSGEYEIDKVKFIDKINGNNEGKNIYLYIYIKYHIFMFIIKTINFLYNNNNKNENIDFKILYILFYLININFLIKF